MSLIISAAPLARSLSKKNFNFSKTFTWTKTAQVEQENWFYAVGLLIRVFKNSVALKSLSCACGHFKC